jgi:predicted metal-dependent enzyme (double-stranded beta helix superfamily)
MVLNQNDRGDAMMIDGLVERCLGAAHGTGGAEEVARVLRSAVSRPEELAAALGPVTAAGETTLFSSPELTVAHLVWGPRMVMYPHDHRMWVVIGVYRGAERNVLHRRSGDGLATTGALHVGEGEVALLDGDVIHSVINPRDGFSAALHVFGGDFVHEPRSEWDWKTLRERPYDDRHAQCLFAAANLPTSPQESGIESVNAIGGSS